MLWSICKCCSPDESMASNAKTKIQYSDSLSFEAYSNWQSHEIAGTTMSKFICMFGLLEVSTKSSSDTFGVK